MTPAGTVAHLREMGAIVWTGAKTGEVRFIGGPEGSAESYQHELDSLGGSLRTYLGSEAWSAGKAWHIVNAAVEMVNEMAEGRGEVREEARTAAVVLMRKLDRSLAGATKAGSINGVSRSCGWFVSQVQKKLDEKPIEADKIGEEGG